MEQPYTFKQIKDYIKAQPELMLAGLEERPTANIKKFMENFFTTYNSKYNTVYVGNGHAQTGVQKRRSICDIYRVMLYYFPNLTITTCYSTLYELIAENKVLSAICHVLKVRVYRAVHTGEKGTVNSALTDEFGVDIKKLCEAKGAKIALGYGWGKEYTEEHLKMIAL